MPDPMPDLAVVIPAWNEAESLDLLLPQLSQTLAGLGVDAEIIVADGGSVDGTADVARSLGARVVQQSERGYGGALLAAFEAASASWIVTMDADLSHPPAFIGDLWRHRADAELLIASRFVPGGKADTDAFRLFLSRVLNTTFRWILSLPLRDLSSGFRCYRRDVVLGINPVARDFDFLQEVLVRAYKRGHRVLEIPFHYQPRVTGRSHVRLFRFGLAYGRTLWRLWRMR